MTRFIEDIFERGVFKPAEAEQEIYAYLKSLTPGSMSDEERRMTPRQLAALIPREELERRLALAEGEYRERKRLLSQIEALQEAAKEALRGAVVIVADNVAEYVYVQSGKTAWDVTKDFPCLAPPFNDFWIEMRLPVEMLGKAGQMIPRGDLKHTGFHFRALTPDEFVATAPDTVVVNMVGAWREVAARIASVYRIENYLALSRPYGPSETHFLPIDEHGQPLAPLYQLHDEAHDEEGKKEQEYAAWFLAPALLTVSFMHCKNVEIVENEPDAKLQKARARRGKKPLISWKTLNITPMQKVLKTEGGIEQAGIKRALHICRGHFKNFQNKGLFGRHKGLYWWDSQVRGKVTEGVVVKDYAVKKSA